MAIKLSNVIGAPFADYVLRQLVVRTYNSSTGTTALGARTNDQVLYLANKNAWARLVSSVDIYFPPGANETYDAYIQRLGIEKSGRYGNADSLAKNWILQAGLSKEARAVVTAGGPGAPGIDLRYGIGPDGAYGIGGTAELGYRPMPGLTSVTIETAGRLGSLRTATINFKVWNMNQLNTIEALYFRLGYSMLLEWGHTQYFENPDIRKDGTVTIDSFGNFVKGYVSGIDNPFDTSLRKEDVQQQIEIKKRSTSGNYDGMLGIVVNFNWSFNQEGGYDCSIKLVGLGAVMNSLRINQAYKLPTSLVRRFKQAADALKKYLDRIAADAAAAASAAAAAAARGGGGDGFKLDPPPKSIAELYEIVKKFGGYTGTFDQFRTDPKYLARGISNFNTVSGQYSGVYVSLSKPPSRLDDASLAKAKEAYDGVYFKRGDVLYKIPLNREVDATLLVNQARAGAAGIQSIDSFIAKAVERGAAGGATLSEVKVGLNRSSNNIPDLTSDELLVQFFDFKSAKQTSATVSYGRYSSYTREYTLDETIKQFISSTVTENSFALSKDNPDSNLSIRDYEGWGNPPKDDVFFDLKVEVQSPDTAVPITKRDILIALDKWIKEGAKVKVSQADLPNANGIVTFTGKFTVQVKKIANPGTNIAAEVTKDLNWTFKTNNISFFNTTSDTPPAPPGPSRTGGGAGASTNDSTNKPVAATEQKDPYLGFESALHAMLTIVQYEAQSKIISKKGNDGIAFACDLTSITRDFYNDGSLAGVLDLAGTTPVPPSGFNLKLYAAKGFNSQLMADNSLFESINYIGGDKAIPNFNSFCKALVVTYRQSNLDGNTYPGQYPVYIPLGYLLAFINNMCLFYDSKQKTTVVDPSASGEEKRPYVYIDFNPETNFCLTLPQQFSVDPNTCLIPANLDQTQYKELFPPNAQPTEELFNPTGKNIVSDALNKAGLGFQSGTAYRGKTMNIMISTQYLLNILREFSTGDPQHAVALHPFLERVMRDVNKSLGNINSFRIAYRDDTNTIQIQDDQYVPPLETETTMITKDALYKNLKENVLQSGELPIFASQINQTDGTKLDIPSLGIARQMQLRTSLSTKLASMIAISAQAATGSVNSTDYTSLSWLNKNFQDRYKPYIVDQDNGSSGNSKNTQKKQELSNDQRIANLFNKHVKSVYSNPVSLFSEDAIEPSKNYYIERMSKKKSGDPVTIAAPFIPAELELTLDGISGIIMGNAFSIPQSRLPNSYKGSNNNEKDLPLVGFIVNGLTHTIQNNEWTTTIKGQMIKLREMSGLNQAIVAPQGAQTGADVANNSADRDAILQKIGGPCERQFETRVQSAIRNKPGFTLLQKALTNNGYNSKIALASILAIAGGESSWEGKDESYQYSDAQFKSYFSDLTADQLRRAIAARDRKDKLEVFRIIYGERALPGLDQRGREDGARYYGRGYVQLTGRSNYQKVGDAIGVDLVNNPELAGGTTDISARATVAYYNGKLKDKGVDINDPDFMAKAIKATGNSAGLAVLERKVGYYNCLLTLL